jgi:hypothetical protein
MSEGRLPKPRTAHEVQLDIVAIGGLIEWKPLCPPFRGDGNYEETVEVGPLIPDEIWVWWNSEDDEDWSEERKQVEAYLYLRGL